MRVEQVPWSEQGGWQKPATIGDAQMVLVFGQRSVLENTAFVGDLSSQWPQAAQVGCSTAGQIQGTEVSDDGAVATAVHFDHTTVRLATVAVTAAGSAAAGAALAKQLAGPNLVHVLIISEGLDINGEALVRGLGETLPAAVSVTGGLSADGEHFKETLVLSNGTARKNTVAAIGLYSTRLKVGYGSLGGWDPFGPERQITRSEGNVLYELDGQSALALYKRYLGDHAADLPASGLLFPLSLRTRDVSAPVVRTILSVNESDQTLTFAGDVPTGGYVRLMKANFDRLIDGAVGAGRVSADALGTPVDLALLISCVGRRMVLRQRVEEEVEGVRDIVGPHAAIAGFYSYGEISPFTPKARCELHNQTMTVTTFFRTMKMAELHSLLRRQLKRHFPDEPVPPELDSILAVIDQAYHQFDNDRAMLERSLDLSSQELLQANGELRALVSAFPDHIVRVDPGGIILDIRGAPSEQSWRWLPGLDFLQTLDARARQPVRDALQRVGAGHAAISVEFEANADTGKARFYEARLLPLGENQVLMILRDVTERHHAEQQLRASQLALHEAHRDLEHRVEERTAALGHANEELRREMAERQAAEAARSELEEQLRHAQKMEAIGRLSGGIAHDFNNLLTAIRGYSELLMRELRGSPLLADVEEIFNAADRAATLTGQLLAFSRRQILTPEIVVLNQRVSDMSRMLVRLIGEHIAIDLRLASDLWPVRADAAQLEQVLVNLALNARDAMPDGGRLAIETANRDIKAKEAKALEVSPGPFVELRVRDTGVGIPLDLQGRIFEPFFTTKPKGAGTGLGLSMVYGFVRQSGGAITVASSPGDGTTFSLLLPRTDDKADRTPTPRSLPHTERGSGTVLIAEDERALRRLLATVLGHAGYRTIEASDGQQALDMFAIHQHAIVVVVTDLVMPRMGGIELAKRLRQSHPALPILLVTGYVEQSEALLESTAGAQVLLKPFSPEALLRAVAAAVQAAKT